MNSRSKKFISFKYIYDRVFKFKGAILLIFLLYFIWSISSLIIPFATKSVVDIGVENKDLDAVQVIILSLLILYVINLLGQLLPMWILRHIGVRINLIMVVDYFRGVLQKPYLYFNSKEQGETIQNVNDNMRIESFITSYSFMLVKSIVHLILYASVLYIFNSLIGLIFIGFNLAYFFWYLFIFRFRKKADAKYFKTGSLLRAEINEIFKGIVDLKSNNQELDRINNWQHFQNKYSSHRLNLLRYHLYIESFNNTIQKARDLLILYVSVIATVNGSMTLGTLVAIQYIMSDLNDIMRTTLEALPKYQDAQLSIARLNKTLDGFNPHEQNLFLPKYNTINSKATIALKSIDFSYKEGHNVLNSINITIPYSSSVALLGESGSGKSTLLKILLKLLNPNQGEFLLEGNKINHIDDKSWLIKCSVVLQESILFNRNLLYNITFSSESSKVDISRIWHCLQIAQAKEFVSELPHGLDTIIGTEGTQLSRGQQQRILIARMLYKDVDYYFMDEPFSALDRLTYLRVLTGILKELKDKTLIIVTHRLEVAQRMELIYLLEKGRIIEKGSHDELVSLGKRYTDIFISEEI